MDALANASLIKPSNKEHPKLIGWTRSSRTDRGVHATRTVLSMKLELDKLEHDTDPAGLTISDRINEHLPEDIRILAALKVPRPFDARYSCTERTYKYWVPANFVDDSKLNLDELKEVLRSFQGVHAFHNFCGKRTPTEESLLRRKEEGVEIYNEETVEEDEENRIKKPAKRMSREEQREVFKGQAEWNRNVKSFEVTGPFTYSGSEWYCFTVTSNSFLYHMIRKMMTTVLAVLRGVVPPLFVQMALNSPFQFAIPLAPGDFLYLDDNRFSLPKDSGEGIPYAQIGLRVDLTKEQEKEQGNAISLALQKLKSNCPEDVVNIRAKKFEEELLLPHIVQLEKDGKIFEKFEENMLWFTKPSDWDALIPLYEDFVPQYEDILKRRLSLREMRHGMRDYKKEQQLKKQQEKQQEAAFLKYRPKGKR